MCFVVTKSFALTCCAPFILMGARYCYSRKVILGYLDCALHTDMADIEAYYMKPTGKRTSRTPKLKGLMNNKTNTTKQHNDSSKNTQLCKLTMCVCVS